MAGGVCGTDIHIFRGQYMGSYPIIPGHELSGVVENVGSGMTRFAPGDRVAVEPNIACDNCVQVPEQPPQLLHQLAGGGRDAPGRDGLIRVRAGEIRLRHRRSGVRAGRVYGAVVVRVAWRGEARSCHCLESGDPRRRADRNPVSEAIRLRGAAEVTVADKNPDRCAFAMQSGADFSTNSIDGLTRDSFDAVIDATVAVAVMSRAPEFVRPGGKILLFGVPPAGEKLSVEAFPIFRKGLTILSSFTPPRNS
jgi:D-arabinitol dehydrogenase (NADP+)